ncbi:MAG: 5'-deoxynucleotidase [Oscillospiraceae bacterium]
MQTFALNALISRMKYIPRWSLMRCTRKENLSEHTAETAILAHTLCSITNELYNGTLRSEVVATAALYHDASEILTGDMPTPVKYKNAELKAAYKKTEKEASSRLATLLPKNLQGAMGGYITGEVLTTEEKLLLKAADRLSAVIKCIEESAGGSKEFESAKTQQMTALVEMKLPSVDYFLEHMLPCYSLNLDELIRE